MIKEHCYGAITLYKSKEGTEVLIVKGAGYRGFPKGHVEEGEKPIETATRELYEETGIQNATFDETKIFKDYYVFTQKKRVISKHVGYFITYAANKKVILQKNELSSYRRVSLFDARNLLTHDSAKKILDGVLEYIALH